MSRRVIPARNLLQTTLFDAIQMINSHKDAQEVVEFIYKRLGILINPPSYVRIDWDTFGSESFVERQSRKIDEYFSGGTNDE